MTTEQNLFPISEIQNALEEDLMIKIDFCGINCCKTSEGLKSLYNLPLKNCSYPFNIHCCSPKPFLNNYQSIMFIFNTPWDSGMFQLGRTQFDFKMPIQ